MSSSCDDNNNNHNHNNIEQKVVDTERMNRSSNTTTTTTTTITTPIDVTNIEAHAFHYNLPNHYMDYSSNSSSSNNNNDHTKGKTKDTSLPVPMITRFAAKKVQQLMDVVFSIQLTEQMFQHYYNDSDNEDDHNQPSKRHSNSRSNNNNSSSSSEMKRGTILDIDEAEPMDIVDDNNNNNNDDDMIDSDDDDDDEGDDNVQQATRNTTITTPSHNNDTGVDVVNHPTTTLSMVMKRCSRILSIMSSLETLKYNILNGGMTQVIYMKMILHLLSLLSVTITYENENDTSTNNTNTNIDTVHLGSEDTTIAVEQQVSSSNNDSTTTTTTTTTTPDKYQYRFGTPKLHYENVGIIVHFDNNNNNTPITTYESSSSSTTSNNNINSIDYTIVDQNEQELFGLQVSSSSSNHQQQQRRFALPTPTREALLTAIGNLLANKGLLRSVSNTSIYPTTTPQNDSTTNTAHNGRRSLLILHWQPLLRMLIRTAPYLNEHYTSNPIQDSTSRTNNVIKRTVQLIRDARHYYEQGIRPPGYEDIQRIDYTANTIWDMVSNDILHRSHTHACYRGTILLYLFLPTRCSTQFYINILPQYWSGWTNIDRCPEYDYLWLSLYCRARKYVSYEFHSTIWDRVRKRILTHCQYWLQLPIGGTSFDTTNNFPRISNPRSRSCPARLKIFVGMSSSYDEGIDFIAKVTKLLVTGLGCGPLVSISDTISVTEGTYDVLRFLAYVTPYFNPSNIGQWTFTLGALLHYFCYELCCRLGASSGIAALQQSHSTLVDTIQQVQIGSHNSTIPVQEIALLLDALLPICQQTLYSKNTHVGRAGEAAMLYLVQIDPIHTTPALIDFTCRALDISSINLSHQAPAAISALTRLIQPSLRCNPSILLSRLPNILRLTLAGIDCNDQNKAIRTLIFYRSLLCWLPIGPVTEGCVNIDNKDHIIRQNDGTIRFGNNLYEILSQRWTSPEYNAAIEALPPSSVLRQGQFDEDISPDMNDTFLNEAFSSLSDWSLEFLDRVFELLRASGEREKKAKRSSGVASRHSSADVQQARNFSRVLKETLSQLFASMDDSTHLYAIRIVCKFIQEETLPSAAKDASLLCQATAASRSGAVVSPGLDMLIPILCDNMAHNSIKTLTYRLRCLAGAVRSASTSVLAHRSSITTAINLALASNDRHLFKTGCKLLRHTLTTLVESYPHSYDMCPRLFGQFGNGPFLGKSAVLHEDSVRWHTPNQDSIQFACDLLQKHIGKFLNALYPVHDDKNNGNIFQSLDINLIRRGLRVIRYSIRGGASILLDSCINPTYGKDSVPHETACSYLLHLIDEDIRMSVCSIRGNVSSLVVLLSTIIASDAFRASGINDDDGIESDRRLFPLIASDPKICKETTDLSLLLLTRRGAAFRSQEARTIWKAQKQMTSDFMLSSQVDQIATVLQCADQYACAKSALYKDGEDGGKALPRRLLLTRVQIFHDSLQRSASFEVPRRLRILERNTKAVRRQLFNSKSSVAEIRNNMENLFVFPFKSPLDGYEGIADGLYALCCHSNAQVRKSALGVIDYTMTRFGWLVAVRVPRLLSALALKDDTINVNFGIPSFCVLSDDINQQGKRKKLADAVVGVCSILSLSRAMKHILNCERLRYQFTRTVCETDMLISLLPAEDIQKLVHYMQSVFSRFRSKVYCQPRYTAKDKEYHQSNLTFTMNILSEKSVNFDSSSSSNGDNGAAVHWRKKLLAGWFLLSLIDSDDTLELNRETSCRVWATCFRIIEAERGQPLQRVGLGLFGRLLHVCKNNRSEPPLKVEMTRKSFCRDFGEALVHDHRQDTSISGSPDAQWATGVEDIIADTARSVAPRNLFPFQRTNQASGEYKQSHSQLVELYLDLLDVSAASIVALHLLEYAKELMSSPPNEDQRNQQISAAEIFGGVSGSYFRRIRDRYSFKWDAIFQPFLDDAVVKIPFALSGVYFDSVRYAIQFSSPNRFEPLTTWIMEKLLQTLWQPPQDNEPIDGMIVLESNASLPKGTEGFTTQSKWLYLFTAVLIEIDENIMGFGREGFWYKVLLFSDNAFPHEESKNPALATSWKFIIENVLPCVLHAVGHPFDSCRDHIARCLFTICYCHKIVQPFTASVDEGNDVDLGSLVVAKLSALEPSRCVMKFVERYNALSTARRFLSYNVQLGEAKYEYAKNVIPLLHLAFETICPFVDDVPTNDGKDVNAAKRALEAEVIKSYGYTLAEVSVTLVMSHGHESDLVRVLDIVESACIHENWQVRETAIHFLRCFQGAHKFIISHVLSERTMLIITNVLADERREVCSAGIAALTGLLASCPVQIVNKLVTYYIHMASSSLLNRASKGYVMKDTMDFVENGIDNEMERLINQKKSVLFLCAAIMAQPYETPFYVPAALAAISKHSFERNAPLSVRDAVKRCCAEYKKNHMSDNWELHRSVFSQEQLDALDDVVSTPHYYA